MEKPKTNRDTTGTKREVLQCKCCAGAGTVLGREVIYREAARLAVWQARNNALSNRSKRGRHIIGYVFFGALFAWLIGFGVAGSWFRAVFVAHISALLWPPVGIFVLLLSSIFLQEWRERHRQWMFDLEFPDFKGISETTHLVMPLEVGQQ